MKNWNEFEEEEGDFDEEEPEDEKDELWTKYSILNLERFNQI